MNNKDFEILLNGIIEHLQELNSVYVGDLDNKTYEKVCLALDKKGYEYYFNSSDDTLKLNK